MTTAEKKTPGPLPRGHMRWRRGLLRLWVVGTVLWLLFAAVVTGFPAALKTKLAGTQELKCPNKGDGTIDFACMEGQGTRHAEKGSGIPTLDDRLIGVQELPGARDTFPEALREFLWIGLPLPIMVFCLGISLGWAISGFRPNE